MEQDIINDYLKRTEYAVHEAQKYKKLAETYSLYRLAAFALFILSVCLAIYTDAVIIIALALVVLIFCFSWLVKKQNHFEKSKNYWLDIKKVNENEAGCLQASANMYDNGAIFNNDKHYYTSDLDIYGNGSLYHLVNRAATFPGMVKAAQWLDRAASKKTIMLRQQAIKEIAAKNDWKLKFQASSFVQFKTTARTDKKLTFLFKAACCFG